MKKKNASSATLVITRQLYLSSVSKGKKVVMLEHKGFPPLPISILVSSFSKNESVVAQIISSQQYKLTSIFFPPFY
jgi:hypothetical protein